MKLQKLAGATSEIWQVFIRDSSSTTGAGLTGLVFNSASLSAYYHRDTDTAATAITLATMTVGTFTSSGFKEIDATNMPGWYQFCPPNAALASGAKSCAFHLKGAANMAPLPLECQLTAVDPDVAAPAAVVAAFADGLLDRNMATGTDSGSPTVRTVRQALRYWRNKVATVSGNLTVYKEDDTTASWTASQTTDAAALPVISSDPA